MKQKKIILQVKTMLAISKRKGKNGKRKTNAVRKPTLYTKPIVTKILSRLIGGETLVRICSDTNMPTTPSVYNWIKRYPEFREDYELAKTLQMDALGERLLDIPHEYKDMQQARLLSDNIKWLMSKVAATKYGNRQGRAGHSTEPVKISVTYVRSPNMTMEN